MSIHEILPELVLGAVLTAVVGLALLNAVLRLAASPLQGEHIAEVWLEWPICRGSVMYRQRYRWKWMAVADMRLRASMLGLVLPKYWLSTDNRDRVIRVEYPYGISYGIRRPTACEFLMGINSVWSVRLPGQAEHSAEHREGHPILQEFGGTSPKASGYKV